MKKVYYADKWDEEHDRNPMTLKEYLAYKYRGSTLEAIVNISGVVLIILVVIGIVIGLIMGGTYLTNKKYCDTLSRNDPQHMYLVNFFTPCMIKTATGYWINAGNITSQDINLFNK